MRLQPHLVFTSLLLVACGQEQPHGQGPRDSVIVISLDTLRRDHLGLHGYERDTTPRLEALAEEGLVFERCYTTMSWTLIAHMSLLTGMYPSQHKVWTEDAALPYSIPTLAQRLKDLDYHTMGFHFPGWLDPRYGYDRGFDVYLPHRDAEEAEGHMLAAMEERPKDQPFFLFIHLFDAHNAPLRKSRTLYEPPPPFDEAFLPGASERLEGLDFYRLWNANKVEVTPEQHEAIVALYDGGIRYVDHKVGAWVDRWREEGVLDSSILVVTSDHGEGLRGRTQNYGGHGGTQEEGLLVPLVLRLPEGRSGGQRIEAPVSHVDLTPTLLDLLGLPEDPMLPGTSLLGELPLDRMLFAERTDRRVTIRWPHKVVDAGRGRGRLYDLEQDPEELEPVFVGKKSPQELQVLVEELNEQGEALRGGWFDPGEAESSGALSEQERAALDALGYGGGDDEEDE